VLLDRRKVKFWQKIIFGFMAFLMAAFLVVGYSGVLNGCEFLNSAESASETLDNEVASAKAATVTTPTDAAAWIKLAEAYLARSGSREQGSDLLVGDLKSSAKAYEQAEELLAEQKGAGVKAQRLDVLNQLATVYAELQDSAATVRVLQEITALTPKDSQAFLNLGLTARSAGDNATALLAFSKFLDLDPKSPYASDVKAAIAELAPKSTSTPSPSPTE
jgi:cytochrome c-type biogenesis protein CcmH/NrfG